MKTPNLLRFDLSPPLGRAGLQWSAVSGFPLPEKGWGAPKKKGNTIILEVFRRLWQPGRGQRCDGQKRNEMVSVARCRDPGFCVKCSGVSPPQRILEGSFPMEIQYKSRVMANYLVATFKKVKRN